VQLRALGLFWLSVGAISLACSSAELKQANGSGSSSGDPSDPDSGSSGVVGDGGRDPSRDLDGGKLPVTSAVSIQVMPSDNGAAVLAAIQGAKKSLHMTMYLLSDDKVINALVALKQAGKEVKIILNQNFPQNAGSNQTTYNTLKNKGVDVVWAPPGYTYTHAKTVIIDGTSMLVMTMNLTYSSPSTNREYIATVTDADDIAEAETIFQSDYANQSSLATGKLLVSPRNSVVLDARSRLIALIDSATSTLDIEGETLSDDPIVAAIIAAHQAGVAVRVVIDAQTGSTAQQESVAQLKAAGVPIKALGNPDIHSKAIVADGKLAYVGSQNFTANSLNDNREIGIITDAVAEIAKVTDAITQDFQKGNPL
jgi:phosphatidylserine/phosphatidylglycerophosphate/cardiolipin synthase-like enzyme